MRAGQRFDGVGTVADRRVFNSGKSVRATLHTDTGGARTVLWWDRHLAPQNGARVRLQGTVRDAWYGGGTEVHVRRTEPDRQQPPPDDLARVAGFYRDCVEAEAAASSHLQPGSAGHVELVRGASPFHGPITLPNDPNTVAWCAQRASAPGEADTLVAGWPLAVGPTKEGRLGAVPVLVTGVHLREHRGVWQCERVAGYVELNTYALDVLGYDRGGQQALARAVDDDPRVTGARDPGTRARAILRVLADGGVDGLDDLDPGALAWPDRGARGLVNAGVVMDTFDRAAFVRRLAEDLEELILQPDRMRRGPAAVLLRRAEAAAAPLPEPHPTLAPSTIAQDQAVHAAMTRELTVVTGPPGTGKSQVLVNVVAAAIEQGQTVLLASKNNQAVNVVVERLREASPDGIVARVGNREVTHAGADAIDAAMASAPRDVDEAAARARWNEVRARVRGVHQVLHDHARIAGQLAAIDARIRTLGVASPDVLLESAEEADIDPATLLEGKLDEARTALDAFGSGLGCFGRWRKHQARLDAARAALRVLGLLIDLDEADASRCLAAVAERPTRSLEPRHAFAPVEQRVHTLLQVLEQLGNRRQAQRRLADLPSRHHLEDRLAALSAERAAAGRSLLNAHWARKRADPQTQTVVGQAVRAIRNGGAVDPAALRALPVWALTNLSARATLPLYPGLFDLVVIDEASQCDAASALPLLVRAKRAMIIGDPKQLTHITTLSEERQQLIAARWGLTDAQTAAFSYRTESCYALAEGAAGGRAIFLDLHFRSHPAVIGFANRAFYGGKLDLCSSRRPPDGMRAIEWEQVTGLCARGPLGRSRVNEQEAAAVVDRIAREFDAVAAQRLAVGVVTAYSAQAELIAALLSRRIGAAALERVTIATAHRFQGDECDVLYFSPVVDRSMSRGQVGFAANRHLINVALTRARRRLVVVGDGEACSAHHTILRDLRAYVASVEASGYAGPVEMALAEALARRAVPARPGLTAAGRPLALAVEDGTVRLDVECDGPAFPGQANAHTAGDRTLRDQAVRAAGWQVMRFSVREVARDPDGAAERIRQAVS